MRRIQLDSNERVESGPIEFVFQNGTSDWRGIFLRGDWAGPFGFMLELYLEHGGDVMMKVQLQQFAKMLRSCEHGKETTNNP